MTHHLLALLAAGGLTACENTKTAPPVHEQVALTPPATPAVNEHAGHGAAAAADGRSSDHAPTPAAVGGSPGHGALSGYATVAVDPTRQQLLGIKTAPVERQTIDRNVRTVGIVQTDETRTSHVHVKFEGFIERTYVNYTGRLVRKGQPLFTIFSRELLAAEQEYVSSRTALARVPAAAGEAVRGSAQQLAAASRERLRLFDVPPAVLAEIERTGVAERAITILSPQTGTVVEKQAIAGLAVTPMMHLYVIADLSKVWVLADIYERDLAQIRIGQRAKLRIEALPDRTLEGTATFVSPTVDQATRTVKVRFEFPNREGTLRPGMYATVEIAAPGAQALVIPSDSVIDTGERKLVFVTQGEGRFEPRPIVTGAAFNGRYEVLDGLREGDVIATSGHFLLDSESRIRGARTPGGPTHGGH